MHIRVAQAFEAAGLQRRARLEELITAQQARVSAERDVAGLAQQRKVAAEEAETSAKAAFDLEWDARTAASEDAVCRAAFAHVDADGDARLSPADVQARFPFDRDKDGAVSEAEVRAVLDLDGDGALAGMELAVELEDFCRLVLPALAAWEPPLDFLPAQQKTYPAHVQEAGQAAAAARTRFEEAEKVKKEAETRLEELKTEKNTDYGAKGEFFPLSQCFEVRGPCMRE